MAWFKRDAPVTVAPTPLGGDAEDTPEALQGAIAEVVGLVNASAGRLPPAAVVAARRITDVLAETVATSEVRQLDIHAVLSVRATATDYLPTTVRGYAAVDESLVDVPRADGRTPRQSLANQLGYLEDAVLAVLQASQQQDVDGLLTQGNFLRTKFSRSDLDL